MMPLATRAALLRAPVSRAASRQMSSQPKLHTAEAKWSQVASKRPPKDHLDDHLVFHPPYNGVKTGTAVALAWLTGWGLMAYGMAHQQFKQGFWK